ncbi:MAG: transglutaminase domain-containing protein [Phycisphaerales bacterium]|nr:transglutaminase domain-containing protein [Phycisphaerales bacterium]
MNYLWHNIQTARRRYRWPIKWGILILVVLFVLYPRPTLLIRHIGHLRNLHALPDPQEPSLQPIKEQFDAYAVERGAEDGTAPLDAVEQFVYELIPYAWDWEVWGVADYIPTVREVIETGREDCDGRAVLAAALLRSRGIEAYLVGGNGHIWVATEFGETMGPLGEASLTADDDGLCVDILGFFNIRAVAFGIAVFPWTRELIILFAIWGLLLPHHFRWSQALLALYLLCSGLMTIRLAGADIYAQHMNGIFWAGGN